MQGNEPFAVFCNRIAVGSDRIPDGDHTLPEEYEQISKQMLALLREKKSFFAQYPIPFIQSRFEDLNEVAATLEEKTKDYGGEIPDGLLTYLAYHLYSTEENKIGYNNLPAPQQNIIKVVSCYIILHS